MKLKILTWNMAWAYGIGSDGSASYEPREASHFDSALHGMSELIRNLDVDVVLLQEVDFASKRSHYQNQLEILSRTSGLLHRAKLVSWDHPYVPFPGLSLKKHFGKMNSGGAILSKHPIKPIFYELLPKPKENSALYNWFYLNRYLQAVEIEGLRICNLHLEAFSQDNRELQLIKLQNSLKDYSIDLAGGDFNGAVSISEELAKEYECHPSAEATFPSNDPAQVLDGFVIKKNKFKSVDLKTINSGLLSDHFALLLEIAADPLGVS